MMSKSSYLTDNGDHDVPHLMFFQTDKPETLLVTHQRGPKDGRPG
jgi:hypothetical protein